MPIFSGSGLPGPLRPHGADVGVRQEVPADLAADRDPRRDVPQRRRLAPHGPGRLHRAPHRSGGEPRRDRQGLDHAG